MSRMKQYDRTELLDRSVELFRRQGFNGTSTAELVAELNVNRKSMYAEFGSKQQLLEATLEHYNKKHLTRVLTPLEAPDASLEGIRQAFYSYASAIEGPFRGLGCLMCNIAVERGGSWKWALRCSVPGTTHPSLSARTQQRATEWGNRPYGRSRRDGGILDDSADRGGDQRSSRGFARTGLGSLQSCDMVARWAFCMQVVRRPTLSFTVTQRNATVYVEVRGYVSCPRTYQRSPSGRSAAEAAVIRLILHQTDSSLHPSQSQR